MQHRRLLKGDVAPDFTLKDVKGKQVSLRELNHSFVLIAFLRYSSCPWCNLAIHRLTMEYPLLHDAGMEVVAFVQSSEGNIEENIYERHEKTPQFPIIADPAMKTYRSYGVRPRTTDAVRMIPDIPAWVKAIRRYGWHPDSIDANLFLAPAVFLIGPGEQRILSASYVADLYRHESFSSIYDSAAALHLL